MAEVVLVRHAQASAGTEDYDRLSPLGHEQAEWLGLWLRAHDLTFDRVYRGNLRRHAETAAALHGLGPNRSSIRALMSSTTSRSSRSTSA